MRRKCLPVALAALGFVLSAVSFALGQGAQFPQTLPANTVVGRLGAGVAGPAQAIPFATLLSQMTAGSTFNVGGGVPLSMPSAIPVTLSAQYIPQAATTTANPVLAVERSTTYSAGTLTSPTLYAATQAAFTGASAWASGLVSEMNITANSTAGTFAEGARLLCTINGSLTAASKCTGGVGVSSATQSGSAVYGYEGEVSQTVVDAPTPPSFPSASEQSIGFLATNNGTKKADAAFVVNPYQAGPAFQAGFSCPQEQSPGSAGTEIGYACFEGAVTATYGIDLSLGTWGTAAISTPGFAVLPTGNINLAPTTGNATININNIDATHNAKIFFQSNSASKFEAGINSSANFFIHDDVGNVDALAITSNGAMTLAPKTNSVLVNGATAEGNMDVGGDLSVQPATASNSHGIMLFPGASLASHVTLSFNTTNGLVSTWGATFAGPVIAQGLVSTSDPGGTASDVTISNASSTTISTGTGTVKMSSANSANNAAWLKIYIGVTAYWIPAWTTNAP